MDMIQMVREASTLFQQIHPGFLAAADMVGKTWVAGKTVIELVQKGKELFTYRITNQEQPEPVSQPALAEPKKNRRAAPRKKRPHVAIIVDITLRTMPAVAEYLDDHKIKAELIIVTNDPNYGPNPIYLPMDDPEKWTAVIREFCNIINGIRYHIGNANIHIFMAAPLPIAFGMGAVWGTIMNATIYHWDPKMHSYTPVVKIDRTIRQGEAAEPVS